MVETVEVMTTGGIKAEIADKAEQNIISTTESETAEFINIGGME